MATNKFEKYSSKVNPLYIPLPNFKFFHGSSSEEKVDDKYIRREGNIERLKSWLTSVTDTGVYLVTGFRGMGKSSFVGAVLKEITEKSSKWFSPIFKVLMIIVCAFVALFPVITYMDWNFFSWYNIILTFFLIICSVFIFLDNKKILKLSCWDKKKRIIIKLNLGHEILNERDILSLISNSIEYEYKKYIKDWNEINFAKIYVKWMSISFITVFFSPYIEKVSKFLAKCIKLDFISCIISGIPPLAWSIIVFCLCSFLWKLVRKLYIEISPNNPTAIYNRLHDLNQRIISSTNEDVSPSGVVAPAGFGITINQRRNRNYIIADVREIEQRLSWILSEIAEGGSNAPKFIIVFDELDKVDPTSKSNTDDPTNVIPAFENSGSGFTGGTTSRKRKQNLMRLLANMKYFISTAKVKFVFIAGRELYDAYLADASDREFAVGSIFNGVIELKSFLDPDPAELREVTAMTQRYICKLILPQQEVLKKSVEFKDAVDELRKKFKKEDKEESKKKGKKEEWEKEVNYYIFTTYNIILKSQSKHFKVDYEKAKANYETNKTNYETNKANYKKVKADYEYYETNKMYYKINPQYYEVAKTHHEIAEANYRIAKANYRIAKKIKADYEDAKADYEDAKAKYEKAEAIRKRTIIMLNQYAVYLSHFSNGAPKKITNLFEKYVWEKLGKEKDMETEGYIDILGNVDPFNKSKYYMVFTYKTQRKIGFIHHLFFPVINAVLNNASRYGDKLLISAGFLTNHLYKYHNSGFSWRNIESIPELMDINKSPETREFIETVIQFLQHSHLSATTINSLYHYKFPLRLAEEISIMSRLSTELSALLNFSLDDSLSLKMHYTELLNYYTARQNNTLTSGGNNNTVMVSAENDFHHIIANIHHVLGDLHMFSEDYNEAIYEYQCSVDILTRKQPWEKINDWCKDPHTSLHILSVVRIMLKLGLAFEKRKTSNDAYLIYNEIVAMLKEIKTKESNLKNQYRMKALFDDINLVYQALLARLFVLEKRGLSGINVEDIDKLEEEFLELSPKSGGKNMIKADFLRKLADILYYKNGLVNMDSFRRWNVALYLSNVPKDSDLRKDISSAKNKNLLYNLNDEKIIEIIQKESGKNLTEKDKGIINKVCCCINQRKHLLSGYWREDIEINVKDKRTPCYACRYYNQSLETMRKYLIQEFDTENQQEIDERKSKSIFFINQLRSKENFKSLKERDILTLAFALDGLGNVLFSCSMTDGKRKKDDKTNTVEGNKIRLEFMKKFAELIERENNYDDDGKRRQIEWEGLSSLSSLEKSLLYYWAASAYFKYSGNMKEAFFCYKKVLYVLVSYLEVHKADNVVENYLSVLKKDLVGRAIQNLYIQYENTNMVEIGMLKDIFIKDEYQHIPLNLLSAFPDLEEIMILYSQLELLCEKHGGKGDNEKGTFTAQMYQSLSLSPYRMASTITERILALRFKADVNMKIFTKLLKLDDFEIKSYNPKFPVEFYEKFSKYLKAEIDLDTYSSFISVLKEDKNDRGTKLDLVEFLITDTKFALSKIIETISPTTQTTLFTESFMGGVYMQLFECSQVFDFIYLMYRLSDKIKDDETEAISIIKRIWSFYVTRIKIKKDEIVVVEKRGNGVEQVEKEIKNDANTLIESIWEANKTKYNVLRTQEIITKFKFVEKNVANETCEEIGKDAQNIIKHLKGISDIIRNITPKKKEDKKDIAKSFREYLDNHIDYADQHNNNTNYLHEMALRKYKRAIEMHHEGGAYQELLNSMYFLEDNLNNNTYQFHFAVERYNNNCGILNERVKRLKKISNTSSLLNVDKYVMEADKWPQ